MNEAVIHIAEAKNATAAPPPLGLYIHLPWCVSKCPYCDFNSHKKPHQLPEKEYIEALCRDLETTLPAVWERRLQTVFIGGGTPSLFSPEQIDRLLSYLRALFNLSAETEITMEANPDSVEQAKFAEFRAAGINRLSLGVQSFNDDALRTLQRAHNGKTAERAAGVAAEVFDNFNIDLMHALPGQTPVIAVNDVRRAVAFAPTHLSLYQLTLEPNTPFFDVPPAGLPDDDTTADIGDAVVDFAAAAGYQRYEISAYAKDGKQCAHNLNYWQFGDYLGIGAGAHAKITSRGDIHREVRIKHPGQYMQQLPPPLAERWQVPGKRVVFEFFLNALRLTNGFPLSLMQERIGAPSAQLLRILDEAEADNLIKRNINELRPTEKGLRYLNELLQRFIGE